MKVQLWSSFVLNQHHIGYFDHLVYMDRKGKVKKIEFYDYRTNKWRRPKQKALKELEETLQDRLYNLYRCPFMEVVWEWTE